MHRKKTMQPVSQKKEVSLTESSGTASFGTAKSRFGSKATITSEILPFDTATGRADVGSGPSGTQSRATGSPSYLTPSDTPIHLPSAGGSPYLTPSDTPIHYINLTDDPNTVLFPENQPYSLNPGESGYALTVNVPPNVKTSGPVVPKRVHISPPSSPEFAGICMHSDSIGSVEVMPLDLERLRNLMRYQMTPDLPGNRRCCFRLTTGQKLGIALGLVFVTIAPYALYKAYDWLVN